MFSCIKNKFTRKEESKYLIFKGSKENYIRNGAIVLEESIKLFHGRGNPIRHFSVDDLNLMNVENCPVKKKGYHIYRGFWEGRIVLVVMNVYRLKVMDHDRRKDTCLPEVVVATQMATHKNAHRILGCCLETKDPVLVCEWLPLETLKDRIMIKDNDDNKNNRVLQWKDRLRIAWEVSHVVAYLHTAFPRPIIYRDLNPSNVFLDQDNAAKLGHFSSCVYIPEGEEYVEDFYLVGTFGYFDSEYAHIGRLTERSDVYSFGVLFLVLLTGKEAWVGESNYQFGVVTWVEDESKYKSINEIVDPAITKTTMTTVEDFQLRASMQLALSCTSEKKDDRPTMVEVATALKAMIRSFEGGGIWEIFEGSTDNFIQNEALVLEESISLFHGVAKPIHYFSFDELKNMNLESWQASWKERAVVVKLPDRVFETEKFSDEIRSRLVREIVVATQMATHDNVQKLLGCCLETKFPVLVYEWVAAETLKDRIVRKDGDQNKPALEWKDRLRIAWEISDVVSYLHTAFPRPIIHRYLGLDNVYLDQDNSAKLFNFSLSVSIPEGENVLVEHRRTGNKAYKAPEYHVHDKCAEGTDVYSFGILFLLLLTGKDLNDCDSTLRENSIYDSSDSDMEEENSKLIDWVKEGIRDKGMNADLDPKIIRSEMTTGEDLQIKASIQLAIRCISEEDSRPTMVEVATELKNMITLNLSAPPVLLRTHSLSCQSSVVKVDSIEHEMGTPLVDLTEQAQCSIQSTTLISNADVPKLIDPEPNNTGLVMRCNCRENVNSSIIQHDHVMVSVTSNIELVENEPLTVPSVGDIMAREVQISNVQYSKKHVILEETSDQVQSIKKKGKMKSKGEMIYRRMQTRDLVCQFPETLQYLVDPEVLEYLPNSCKELHDMMALQPLETSIAVGFSASLLQYPDTQEEFETYVTTHDVVQLLIMQQLNVSCMQIFMRYLEHEYKVLKFESIGFLCPKSLAMVRTHLTFASQYMKHAISKLQSKSYLLGPYYQDNHWTLIVICPKSHVVLFFDPMGKNLNNLAIKGHMNMAYRNCLPPEKSHRSLTWRIVQCPRNLNEVESGYYVMRYMYEIVTLYHQTDINLEECFELKPYTQQQVDAVRDVWARYFIDECV